MFLLRYVEGTSMAPTLRPGTLVVARRRGRRLRVGDVVIIRHDGRDKIKRVTRLGQATELGIDKIYVEGDNKFNSTDSRHFGWLETASIQGTVIWPLAKSMRKPPTSPQR
jgi:hypothetical protein